MKLVALLLSFSLIIIVHSLSLFKFGRVQSIAAKGQLICNGKPQPGVKVKLYDDDRG